MLGATPTNGKRNKAPKMTPTQMIALGFAVIILLGTLLLLLPVSSRDGQSCGIMTALFTATSASCVTGLVLVDTWTQWSGFGQGVLLMLIELGGLGFMSAASLVIFLLRKKVGLRQRMLMAQALSMNEISGVVRLQKWVLFGSLSIQAVGALVLFVRFLPQYGLAKSAWWGVFHAVSAFCNAGFDIVGSELPGGSMIFFQDDPVVLITLMVLIVLGGLGFFVWQELAQLKKLRNLSVYSRLVLITTACLILGGAGLIGLLEWNNPGTLGAMPTGQKILNMFFQSVTLRTAGFASFDQALLTPAGKGVSMFLMLIGGSSGSTAGGIKTVTFLVLLLFVITRARGGSTVQVFKRSVSRDKVMDAMTITAIAIMLALVGAVIICALCPVSFADGLYETVSALATVGLSAGVTPQLPLPAQLLIVLYMYFGRVGVLTLSLGFLMADNARERVHYADTNLLIG